MLTICNVFAIRWFTKKKKKPVIILWRFLFLCGYHFDLYKNNQICTRYLYLNNQMLSFKGFPWVFNGFKCLYIHKYRRVNQNLLKLYTLNILSNNSLFYFLRNLERFFSIFAQKWKIFRSFSNNIRYSAA